MEKSKSSSDVPGYIYTYEIRDSKAPTIKLKIGRAVNLVKRVDQWNKQCASKEQVLRGWYPGTVDPDDDADGGDSRMRGRARAGPKGPLCHRLERLIHLELADLAVSGVYLNPRWPRVQAPPGTASGANGIGNGGTKPCVDCECFSCLSLHKEIFEFQRITSGRNKGREFEAIVQPVIEKWSKFVETYV
ncbi:hypothetical protein FISHEDRAFT_43462 [Fistulina hepatica ATCC 64428]|uniref:DUF1766-domain-containing protein n=1 Tax=Fistulina hepatica ATCC 64428 TaxID=1128425 RepID=A0A0D7AD84_9AGAR|nr:hypothetical protein FISHEDRAFT_43462 [Fistulina hepatica ATCC 64428]